MNVLIVGSGGREHALAWKVAQSSKVLKVFVAPGNAGTAKEPKTENVPLESTDQAGLVRFAKEQDIALTIIGPEAPLAAGLADVFAQHQLACFAPSQLASQLESSKKFAKDFMSRHHIPTASYAAFTDFQSALNYLKDIDFPQVIKASGLASGKGVVIAHNENEAKEAIHSMMVNEHFGSAGREIIIEEFLTGQEVSFIVMVDGKNILPLATSQDHKARDDGDRGPNTGGMGAFSPAPLKDSSAFEEKVMKTILLPTLRGLQAEGIHYRGFLYAGLMIDATHQPKVLEFNCRLGDPETQPLMMRLKSDLIEVIEAALIEKLDEITLEWDARKAVGVVLASQGYPEKYPQGEMIEGLEHEKNHPDTKIFHSGTRDSQGSIVTAGGRVLCVTALGENFSQAQEKAYALSKQIFWEHIYYRKDIGYRAVAFER